MRVLIAFSLRRPKLSIRNFKDYPKALPLGDQSLQLETLRSLLRLFLRIPKLSIRIFKDSPKAFLRRPKLSIRNFKDPPEVFHHLSVSSALS